MEERLKELLERYWEGESSLEEEREMKTILAEVEGYETEKEFFLGLRELKQMEPKPSKNPFQKPWIIQNWWKIAATTILLAGMSVFFRQYQEQQKKEEQALAYAQVMDAFTLINQNMQKGKEQIQLLEELKYLNTPNEIFNITEQKNE